MSAIVSISSPSSGAVAAPAPSTGFDAEQAKCERQLADWVHCASASTPEGKAKIAQLSAKLSAIQARLEQAAAAKAEAHSEPPAPAAAAVSLSPLGGRVDAYA